VGSKLGQALSSWGCPGLQQEGNQGHADAFAAEPGSEAGREAPLSVWGIAERELPWQPHRYPKDDPGGC